MTKFSKPSKKIFSNEPEEIIKEIIVRVEKFKAEANNILSQYRPVIEEANQLIENIFFRFHSVVGCSRPSARFIENIL